MELAHSSPSNRPRHLRISDLAAAERPRERLVAHGPEALATHELLAILIGHGTCRASALDLAARLLADAGPLQDLERLGIEGLRQRRGLGTVSATRILAALELGKRAVATAAIHRPLIDGPDAAALQLVPFLSPLAHEHVFVLVLDGQNRMIRRELIHRGAIDRCLVDPGSVLRPVLLAGAPALVLAHNHPSGDPTPSPEDVLVTHRVDDAARLLGLRLEDHIVVGHGRFASLRGSGRGFRD